MPYCSGCGSRYHEGDSVCKSCGFELVYDIDPKSAVKHPVGVAKDKILTGGERKTTGSRRKKKPENTGKPVLSSPSHEVKEVEEPQRQMGASSPAPPLESRCLEAEVIPHPGAYTDIHLGKGIIKPKWVEVGLDGFHFKYEEPPVSSKKAEPIVKDRSADYRISNPVFDRQSASETTPSNEVSNSLEVDVAANVAAEERPKKDLSKTVDPIEMMAESKNDPHESRDAEPQSQREDVIPNMVDLPESNEMAVKAWDDSVIPPDPETAVLEVLGPDIPFESLQSFDHDHCESCERHDEPSGIPAETTVVEEGDQSAPQMITYGADVVNEVEATPEWEGGREPENLTPIEADAPEKPEEQSKVLWQGQQSWFGIPFPCFYQITGNALMVFDPNGRLSEFKISAIRRITLRQSWFAKVLGIGDLIVEFNDPAVLRQVLTGISNPNKARLILEGLIASGVK
jgi:hypothetical protein